VKKFVNRALAAPNVLVVPIDLDLLEEARAVAKSRIARLGLYSHGPSWRSDICWYSSRFLSQFRRFRSLFDRLDVGRHVAPYLDLDKQVRLYNGFFVVRSRCSAPDFHVDWNDANNEAFTLMTPLTANCGGFGMLYRKLDGSIGEYEYKLGEALIFGDDFVHSTKPGASGEPVVLLCFNFGTDKMEHWPSIERTAARQGLLTCRPDGRIQRLSASRRIRNVLGPALRRAGLLPALPQRSGY
jgi:hypothetical protein